MGDQVISISFDATDCGTSHDKEKLVTVGQMWGIHVIFHALAKLRTAALAAVRSPSNS